MLKKYQDRVYNEQDYNCLHFAVELLRDLTDDDYTVFVGGMMTGRSKRVIDPQAIKQLNNSQTPIDNSLAVMHGAVVHVGVYHNGNIIHLSETGISAQPPHIAQMRHGRITYYAIKH